MKRALEQVLPVRRQKAAVRSLDWLIISKVELSKPLCCSSKATYSTTLSFFRPYYASFRDSCISLGEQ